jgi:uncharacterized protein
MSTCHQHNTNHVAAEGGIFDFDALTFTAMVIYSFSVSAHCAGMCGPLLVNALSKSVSEKTHSRWTSLVHYQLGRAISYTSAGALFGLIGQTGSAIADRLKLGQASFSIALGALLCAMGVVQWLSSSRNSFQWVKAPRAVSFLMKKLESVYIYFGRTVPRKWQSFVLGLLTVILPCMTLSPALVTAATTGSASQGALLLFGFYCGTLPVMWGVGVFSMLVLPRWIPLRFVSGAFLIVAGVVTILRATSLHHWMHF